MSVSYKKLWKLLIDKDKWSVLRTDSMQIPIRSILRLWHLPRIRP